MKIDEVKSFVEYGTDGNPYVLSMQRIVPE